MQYRKYRNAVETNLCWWLWQIVRRYIHEVFAEQYNTPDGAQLLIRAERSRNRKVVDEKESCEFLWTKLNSNRL